jgi:hypothetical protein
LNLKGKIQEEFQTEVIPPKAELLEKKEEEDKITSSDYQEVRDETDTDKNETNNTSKEN